MAGKFWCRMWDIGCRMLSDIGLEEANLLAVDFDSTIDLEIWNFWVAEFV